jgi:hypothetical protein
MRGPIPPLRHIPNGVCLNNQRNSVIIIAIYFYYYYEVTAV